MIIYIAGKISGLPKSEYTKNFNNAEAGLRALGFEVINPLKIIDENLPYAEMMRICFALINRADVLYFMPNWADSNGAKMEHEYAQKLGKIIIEGRN